MKQTSLFLKNNVPASKGSITLSIHLAPLKMPIHLDISPLATRRGVTYHLLHLPTKLIYLLLAPRYVKWNLTLSCWSTLSHFEQHCFIFVDFENSSHRPTISYCICLNQNNIIYFEVPLFCSPFDIAWRVDRNSFLHLD